MTDSRAGFSGPSRPFWISLPSKGPMPGDHREREKGRRGEKRDYWVHKKGTGVPNTIQLCAKQTLSCRDGSERREDKRKKKE